jgi:competence protein ComEC
LVRFTGPELWWLLGVAHWTGGIAGATVTVPSRLLGFLVVAACGIGAVLLWSRLRSRRWARVTFACVLMAATAWVVSVGHGTIVG